MPRLGAIIVGIGDYRYDRTQYPILRYASADADEVVRYLSICWPQTHESTVIRIADADATIDAVSNAFDKLVEKGPYDLQLIFFSGHGVARPQEAGFLLQPSAASAELNLLGGVALDSKLESVQARQTILVLDCCYAEGITRRMRFFSSLGESDARLFIASSREQQLTWEDERIGHGIFTAHLLDLLKTGSSAKLKGVRDTLDVDGELFPVLCDQVPLYVLEHKQRQQEPVKGGVSIRAITLPVARAARQIRERSAFGTALRRLRQIVSGAVLAAVVLLVFAYVWTYYGEADRSGNIRLEHGTKWLAPMLRVLPALRTDTGISASDLSNDPAIRYAAQAGEISGIWTHVSRQGYRAWYDSIRPSLNPAAAATYDVLLAGGAERPVFRLNGESRPSEVALAGWALLDTSDAKELEALLPHIPGADRTSPILAPFRANEMDFSILDLTQPELSKYADALRSAAAVDPDRSFIAYLGFMKASQMWLAHSSNEQHGREAQRRVAEDAGDLLAVIVKARIDRGERGLSEEMLSLLNQLGNLGFANLVRLGMSKIAGTPAEKTLAASKALSAFHGDASEPAEADALRAIKDSLDSSPESQRIVEETYRRFVTFGGPEQADLTGFLISAADRKALSNALLATLLAKARAAVERPDSQFVDTEYARILAHAMGQLSPGSRPVVYRLIEKVTAEVTPMATSTAEIFAALGKQGLETPTMFQRIVALAKDAPQYRPQDPRVIAEPLPGLSIVVGHGPWLTALAILGMTRDLPPEAIDILAKHANDPSARDVILRALVHQSISLDQECWKRACAGVLGAYSGDAARRQLVADVLAEKLAGLPRDQFVKALEELRKERLAETEPELRIALGVVRINAQLARVRTKQLGSDLFE